MSLSPLPVILPCWPSCFSPCSLFSTSDRSLRNALTAPDSSACNLIRMSSVLMIPP